MDEHALKEIRVYLREKKIFGSDMADKNVSEDVVVHGWKLLPGNNIRVTYVSGKQCCAEDILREAAIRQGILSVTDIALLARKLAAAGVPVLGILTEGNRTESFAGVRYLAEGFEDIEADYLERVYRRYKKLPWNILETKRCIIRETVESDVDAFYRIYADSSVTQYMEPLFADRAEELAYTTQYRASMYEFYGFGIWTVLLKETGEIIGRAGLDLREGFAEPELGFVIGVPWQRQGLAGEVCEAILAYGKEELGFTDVQALVQPGNRISLSLLRKLGFTQAGEWEKDGVRYLRYLRYGNTVAE